MNMRMLWVLTFLMAPTMTPASAQEITLDDLVGTTIKSTVIRAQTTRRDGRNFSGKIKSVVEVVFGGKDDPIKFTQTSTWYGQNGRSHTTTRSGSGRLGKPRENRHSGGGHGVGMLMDDTLYYIRTFKTGGFKFEFKMTRTPSGLTCVSRETFLNEKGAGAIRLRANKDNYPIVIVSDKQISSTCQIIKRHKR